MGNKNTKKRPSTETADVQRSQHKIVVAIDVGTYGSGFAFQYRTDFENNRSKVFASRWPNSRCKTTTSLLLKPDLSFDSFGCDARETYYRHKTRDVKDKPKNWEDYLFFENFKMCLYFRAEDQIEDDLPVEAENHKTAPAIVVFTKTIEFMKNKFLEHLKTKGTWLDSSESDATPDHIMWVITVPAIWGEPAKQLMYRAAVKAGISSEHLELAIEPECAAIYCCQLPPDQLDIHDTDGEIQQILSPGAIIMIVDIGGGTVDVAVMMIKEKETMKQVFKSGGNSYGGVRINDKIILELRSVFGEDVTSEFCQKYGQDEKEMFDDIEREKRKWPENKRFAIKFPYKLGHIWESRNPGKNLEKHLQQKNVKKDGGFLLLDTDKIKLLYDECVAGVYDYLKKVMSDSFFNNNTVSALLVVGGFAESKYLVEQLRQRLQDRRIPVIRPDEPEGCVLNGAALYGHDEGMIASRITTKTYGVAMTTKFNKNRHHKSEMYVDERGDEMANNVFRKHIEVGQSISTREWIHGKEYYPHSDNQTSTRVYIFQSDMENPEHTTEEGCTYVGHVDVDFPDREEDKERKVNVDFYFAGTFIKVRAKTIKQTKTLPISRDETPTSE